MSRVIILEFQFNDDKLSRFSNISNGLFRILFIFLSELAVCNLNRSHRRPLSTVRRITTTNISVLDVADHWMPIPYFFSLQTYWILIKLSEFVRLLWPIWSFSCTFYLLMIWCLGSMLLFTAHYGWLQLNGLICASLRLVWYLGLNRSVLEPCGLCDRTWPVIS